jgi:hypothetical protein
VNIRLDPIVPRQIPANEDNTLIDTGRPDDHSDLPPGMQTYTFARDIVLYRSL